MMRRAGLSILVVLVLAASARAEDRVERFPAPDFKSGYAMPKTQTSPVPSAVWQALDVAALALALSVSAWAVLYTRSRKWVVGMTIVSVLYFGFWRKGCVCPVGSIQNVALAAGGHGYALPWVVAAFFVLPLLFTLFYGRVFCAGVCPLGAVQDLVLFKPVHVPAWLELPLGLFAWAYLGLAVLFASLGSDFVICRYDPFVGFFRMSGPVHMIVAGGIILALCLFVGRVYCRFLCPYSVLLRLLSPFSRRQVSITPTHCTGCRLCEQSCPFGALRYPSRKRLVHDRRPRRGVSATTLAVVPALVAAFGFLGYLGSAAMSRLDFTVRLAESVWHEEQIGIRGQSNETKAFHGSGQTPAQLYAAAAGIQHRFSIGTPIFGAWMGLAIGGKLLGLAARRRNEGYAADPAGCLACARCFASCPVEREGVGVQQELEAVPA